MRKRFDAPFRFEFFVINNTFCDMYQGKMIFDDAFDLNFKKKGGQRFLRKILIKLLFQPNKSIQKEAEIIRHVHKLIETPFWKRSELMKPAVVKWAEEGPNRRDYLSFNAIGDTLLKLAVPATIRQVDKLEDHLVNLRLLRIKVALQSYYMNNKSLPRSLGNPQLDLNATWLEDPYDGKAIRYSRSKRRIWSCGKDQKDEGGLDGGKSEWKRKDIQREPTYLLRIKR